jgi:hypothetical protein
MSLDSDDRHGLLKYAHTYLQIHEFISLFHVLLFFSVIPTGKANSLLASH